MNSPNPPRRCEGLPEQVRALARRNFELLKNDPNHPSLHFKKIDKYRSVRVGLHRIGRRNTGRRALVLDRIARRLRSALALIPSDSQPRLVGPAAP